MQCSKFIAAFLEGWSLAKRAVESRLDLPSSAGRPQSTEGGSRAGVPQGRCMSQRKGMSQSGSSEDSRGCRSSSEVARSDLLSREWEEGGTVGLLLPMSRLKESELLGLRERSLSFQLMTSAK